MRTRCSRSRRAEGRSGRPGRCGAGLRPRWCLPLVAVALLLTGCDLLSTEPEASQSLQLPDYPQIPPPQSTDLPDDLVAAYAEDGSRLSLRFLRRHRKLTEWPIDIPQGLESSLRSALLRVAASEGAPRDSVVEIYGIHTFRRPVTRELYVEAEDGASWIDAWEEGKTLTGKKEIDRLIGEWELELKDFSETEIGRRFGILRPRRPLNLEPLGQEFGSIPGVDGAGPNSVFGDGNDIAVEAGDDFWRLSFSVGWGDCPAGCISRHFWHFRVDTEGAVTFEGTSGDPLP